MNRALVVGWFAACSSSSPQAPIASAPVVQGPVAPATPHGGASKSVVVDVSGYWTGDRGQLVVRDENGHVRATYSHDDGTLFGTMDGNKLVGWWCEAPSRTAPNDAGDAELVFTTGADGERTIDGKWRHGAEGKWHETWDLAWDPGQPDPALLRRFDDPSAFCTKP